MGFKFLRQHPIFYRIDKNQVEFFVADFYCSKLKLVLEVDGPIHEFRQDYDRERDLKLKNKGIIVVRLRNDELLDVSSIGSKIMHIVKKCIENSEDF